ncbi:unnamed protein product [Caenorhabditis angaria]|uniref:glutathione transferase n=1 Tax=Caenorhabditis angaria TaxID=860376 RepID=A0A9P1J329_9PELO|nr:unnamed protein product [Caenorhabditis angaria]
MPSFKFYYFDFRGRGEVIRLLFHLAGEQFTDERVTFETWGALKPQMPLGQIPVLDIDGVKIGQTTAIARYLGHQFHRAGTNAVECARLDMIADVIQEMTNSSGFANFPKVSLGLIGGDKTHIFKTEVVPEIEKYAPLVEKFLLDNGNNGLFQGDRETWVDVFAAESFAKLIDYGSPDALDAYPHILALINRVFNHPNIKSYIATRKQTPF